MQGPAALRASRARYSEAIQQTTDQQLLLNLVRLRYCDPPAFLEVGSVSAQFHFGREASLSGTINEGPTRFNPDRLGIDAGISFEERPTVTFAPLQGKDFVNRLLSPLQPEVIILLSRSGWRIDRVMRLVVQSMNGLDNASSASGPTPALAPTFEPFTRACRLFRKLQVLGLLELGSEVKESDISHEFPTESVSLTQVAQATGDGFGVRRSEDGSSIVLTSKTKVLVWRVSESAANSKEVSELLNLLDLPESRSKYELQLGFSGQSGSHATRNRSGITLATRSLMGTLFYLSQGVEVPEVHRAAGLVITTRYANDEPFDWTLLTGDLLRVRCQDGPPRTAAIAVDYRNHWYFIDDTDLNSKATFALLGQLFALQAGGAEIVAPVLTLPIGG